MPSLTVFEKRILLVLALALAASATADRAAWAQAQPEQSAEDQQLEALLSGAELFYKKQFNESQQRWEYQVAWSEGGETSMMVLYVRTLATLNDGSKITVAYAWTQIAGAAQGQELPPAAIKAVASFNDNLYTGNISASGSGVFGNVGMVMKDLSADALWIYLWDLHDTRKVLKKEFDKILAGG